MFQSVSASHVDSLHLFPGKKPQKPPRPTLPKLVDKEQVTETVVPTDGKAGANTTAPTNTEDQSDSKPDVKQLNQADSTQTCTRSVTVHWDIPTKHLCAPTETTPLSSDSEPSQRPVPLPRIKSRKQAIKEEVRDQILVKLSDNSDSIHSDPQEVSTNEYLKELLEVFSAGNGCEEKCDIINQSGEASQGEDAVGEMSTNSQRNIWARIQAFENQTSTDEGNAAEPAKPQPPPRKPSIKPPVAAKPSVAFKPQVNSLIDSYSQNTSTTDVPQNPTSDPRPLPPKKPGGLSIRDELEATLHSKVAIPNRSSASVLTKANSFFEAEAPPVPPTPPAKPFKEPLTPNLNINNHNSASLFSENEYMNTLSGT